MADENLGPSRKLFPADCRCESIQVEHCRAVHDGMANLYHPAQPEQALVINLVAFEEFGIVAEVAKEPVELPQILGTAGEPGAESVPCHHGRLKHGELNGVKRFLPVPTVLQSLDAHQEQTILNTISRACTCLFKARNIALHAAP